MSNSFSVIASASASGRAERVRRVSTGILGQLNAEWSALTRRDHDDDVRRWAQRFPALEPARSPAEVAALVLRRAGRNDPQLAALIALTQEGDPLAGQVLMQVLVGPACRLAARTRHHADSLEAARCQAVGAMWVAVRAYPLPRRTSHVNGLTLDALRLITGRRPAPPELPTETDALEPLLAERAPDDSVRDRFWRETAPEPGAATLSELDELLAWAVRRNVISPASADILRRMHGPQRVTSAVIGRELGLSASAVRERARRALRAVSTAVRLQLGEPHATGRRSATA